MRSVDPLTLHTLDAVETARVVAAGEVSAREVVDASLARIASLDPGLNAFSVVLAERARAEADERDAARAAGEPAGPLHGVPVAIKEEVDVAGCVTTFGGEANSTPVAEDAEVVRRLRAAGAVVVGKTTMPEFGAFPYTESSSRGITRNPWDPTRTPGGSSGGSAVAVSTGMVPVAIGGDGGGSIRIPSACCGLFGLKPQRGRVSTAPHPHLWWALGTAGPLTRTVRDSALVYDVIRGNVEGDLYRAGDTGLFLEAVRRDPGRLRIGWSVTAPRRRRAARPAPRPGGPGDRPAAGRPRPRRARDRPGVPRHHRGLRAAVLRRHPHRGRRSSSTPTASSGARARRSGSAPGCGPAWSTARCA